MSPIDPSFSDSPGDAEVVSSRVLAASRDRIFRALADPEILARWWGPAGFTNAFESFDLRPGGQWRFVMTAPDGTEYRMVNEFVELDPPARIVLLHLEPGHRFRLTMALAEDAGGTRLTWRIQFESAAEAEAARDPISEANEQNFDRLEAVLPEVK